ncbi:MAG: DUF4252 domain-containing protein [Saprospiraceae bacterium]|nr:DUF4252 domain-containing protein [Saprospiraceae bacterium]
MKNLAVIFALLFTLTATNFVQAQDADAISKYFNKYVEDERFTVVYISGKMFDMFGRMELDLEDQEIDAVMEVVKELKGLRILVAEEDVAGLYEEATSTISTKEYEVLMKIRSADGENVQFLVKDSGDTINELLLLVGGEDEFVLMSFVGNIDLSKIGQLAKAFEDGDDDDNDENNK